MTDPEPPPIFRPTATSAAARPAALSVSVSMTVTLTRAAHVFTDVRCRACASVVMRLPGTITTEVHIRSHGYVPQLGRTVRCRRCRAYVEVVELK